MPSKAEIAMAIDPDDIRVGDRIRRILHEDFGTTRLDATVEGDVTKTGPSFIALAQYGSVERSGEWFLLDRPIVQPDEPTDLLDVVKVNRRHFVRVNRRQAPWCEVGDSSIGGAGGYWTWQALKKLGQVAVIEPHAECNKRISVLAARADRTRDEFRDRDSWKQRAELAEGILKDLSRQVETFRTPGASS